jgi:glycerol uptake facilitator-like aquaporin
MALIVGFIFAGLGLSELCGFSSLLLCMAMGAVIANMSNDVGHIMKLCDKITPPIFMLFFVASGADLKLSVLPSVGIAGIIYIVFRVFGKMFGATLGAVISKADKNIKKYLGPALTPQAGVAIGLSLVLVHLVCIRYTGTSVNPARSIGPALFQCGEALSQLWIFIVGPFVGAAIAAGMWKMIEEK